MAGIPSRRTEGCESKLNSTICFKKWHTSSHYSPQKVTDRYLWKSWKYSDLKDAVSSSDTFIYLMVWNAIDVSEGFWVESVGKV